jgi:hypothetical protein
MAGSAPHAPWRTGTGLDPTIPASLRAGLPCEAQEVLVAANPGWPRGADESASGLDHAVVAPQAGASCQPATFNSDTGDVVFTTGKSCFVSVGGIAVFAQFAAGNDFGLQAPALNGGLVPTLDLAPTSVAIDNGTNMACPARDARNFARPFDGDGNGGATCDVGAVEFRPQLLLSNGFE